jgi:hypothetical protein
MPLLSSLTNSAFAGSNVLIRLGYVPLAIVAFVIKIARGWRLYLSLIVLAVIAWLIGAYGNVVVEEFLYVKDCKATPFYTADVRPILADIVRQFFNRCVCWYNAMLWIPYGITREVVFPILREGGLGATVTAFARYIGAIGNDFLIGYVATRDIFSSEMDFTNINVKWQTFWNNWQALLCFGCNDLCPWFTKLPMLPVFFGSDQIRDDQFLLSISNFWNGLFRAFQQCVYILKELVWPTQPSLPRPDFSRTFELWCLGSTAFWVSWENALQRTWDNFISYPFVWRDVLGLLDILTCEVFQTARFVLNAAFHFDDVLSHFAGTDSTYWVGVIKEDYKELIGRLGQATNFLPIVVTIPPTPEQSMVVTHYELPPSSEVKPNGGINPLYGKTLATTALCTATTRVLCDPEDLGIACSTRFAGTLLAGFDICCAGTNLLEAGVDLLAFAFEITLHVKSANDFMIFLDRQPFSSQIRDSISSFFECVFGIFLVIQEYGYCIQRVLTEVVVFLVGIVELLFRVAVALVQTPYFELYLPGMGNFISRPGDQALNEALLFLDRIADQTDPSGLTNCLCFLLNKGFPVPFAGCDDNCTVTGFLPLPTSSRKKYYGFSDSIYNLTAPAGYYRHRLTPLLTYGSQQANMAHLPKSWSQVSGAMSALGNASHIMDANLALFMAKWRAKGCNANRESYGKCVHPTIGYAHLMSSPHGGEFGPGTPGWQLFRTDLDYMADRLLETQAPAPIFNCTDPDNPAPCFNLCCLPKKLIQLLAHTVAFGARALNAAFQTRTAAGSNYWDGTACPASPCFASDLTTFVIRLVAPMECLCEFIKLVIPPAGFADPCCAFTVAGELVSCLLQIVINIGNSIAGDSANDYYYIKGASTGVSTSSPLVNDFNIVLEIVLALFDCVCNFVRIIFATVISEAGFTLEKAFDPCCMPRVVVRSGIEAARLIFKTIIALSTIEQEWSQCYIYVRGPGTGVRPNCVIGISQLPILRDFRAITLAALGGYPEGVQDSCGAITGNTGHNQDTEGVATCLCNTVNAILALVFKAVDGIGQTDFAASCPINICCWFYRGSSAFQSLADFVAGIVASLWQNWQKRTLPVTGPLESFFIPQETLDYLFCDEYGPDAVFFPDGVISGYDNALLQNNPACTLANNWCGTGIAPTDDGSPHDTPGIINAEGVARIKCGKIEPFLHNLQKLLGGCVCTSKVPTNGNSDPIGNGIGNVADGLLRWALAWLTSNSNLFPLRMIWPRCLCSGGPIYVIGTNNEGMLKPLANVIVVGLRQIITLIRNIVNPTYWAPAGGSMTSGAYTLGSLANNLEDIKKTWINRFLAPFADALCAFITNSACMLAMILGQTCEQKRYTVVSSFFRYIAEAYIRLIALIEGAVKMIAQELPGQCVGNPDATNGNADNPDYQGTSGQNGVLQPTCSPSGISSSFAGKLDGNQIGRILVAILTFVVDATIGLGRLGCSSVCPGPPYGMAFPNRTCSCYNLTPYVGVGKSVCSFKVCDTVFNSGLGTFRCPGNTTTCTALEAKQSPNTGYPEGIGALLSFVNAGFCNGGCDNVTAQVLQDGSTWSPAGDTWWLDKYPSYPYVPVYDPTRASTTYPFVCQVTNPSFAADTAAKDEAEGFFGRNLDILTFSVGTGLSCTDQLANPLATCPGTDAYNMNLRIGGTAFADGVCALCRTSSEGGWTSSGTKYDAGTQPICERSWCVQKGWCKNDQMVPSFPGAPILDGIVISALKYFSCLMREMFGDFPAVVFEFLQRLLIFVWQLSGGIIRFSVAIGMTAFNFLTRAPFYNFFAAIPDILGLFGLFFNIFTQPVVFTAGRSVPINSMQAGREDQMQQLMEHFYGFDNGHDCVDGDIVACFCRLLNITDYCTYDALTKQVKPPDIVLANLLQRTRDVFEGGTACDMIFEHLADLAPVNWIDVPYARRYESIQCVARRVQGEIWNGGKEGGWFPKNFFYSTRGMADLYANIRDGMHRFIMEDSILHEETVRRVAREYENSTFHVNKERFANYINGRGQFVKNFYTKAYGMDENSPMMFPMMYLDSVHAKYSSGYYHFLLKRASDNIANGYLLMGSLRDNLREVRDSLLELSHAARHVTTSAGPLLHHAFRIVNQAGRFSWKNVKWPNVNEHVEMPHILRSIVDGTVSSNIRGLFPALKLSWPRVARWPKLQVSELGLGLRHHVTPIQYYNWEAGKRMLYSAAHLIWPQHTTEEVHTRFILGGNCRVFDGALATATRVVDYCLNEFQENIPMGGGELRSYLNATSHLRRGSFHQMFHGRMSWEETRGGGWKRPRIIIPPKPETETHNIDPGMYRRAVTSGGTNLQDIILDPIDRWSGIGIRQWFDGYVTTFRSWTSNGETSVASWPNVGSAYWLRFPFKCQFPENLNCSLGIGIREALWEVGKWYLIVIAVLWIVGGMSFFSFLLTVPVYLLIVAAVGIHYSPACLALFPSSSLGADITIPVLPFPIAILPAMPECFWDEIISFMDDFFNCWTWISTALFNGDQCGCAPSFVNCRDEGISDGIQNVLYYGYHWFGNTFYNIVVGISSTALVKLIPFVNQYNVREVMDNIRYASPTQMERQAFCAWFTILSVIYIFLFGLIISDVISIILPAIIGVVTALFSFIPTLPAYEAITGLGTTTSSFEMDNEDGGPAPAAGGRDIVGALASSMYDFFVPKLKEQ